MSRIHHPPRCAFYVLLCCAGCLQQAPEPIASYTVSRENPFGTSASSSQPQPELRATRILAAMIVHGSQAWFFKLMGPDAAVASQIEPFEALIKSVRFEQRNSEPTWTLPKGWTQSAGQNSRFATIRIPTGDESLDLTVIPLPGPAEGESSSAYALKNVNRWRDQLNQPPVAQAELASLVRTFDLPDGPALVVNLLGEARSDGASAMPMLPATPRRGERPESKQSPSLGAGAQLPPLPFTYQLPANWLPGQMKPMRRAAFEVRDGAERAEITVLDLPPGMDLAANVNRWRGQLGLATVAPEAAAQQATPLEIGPLVGHYVHLVGADGSAARRAILAALVESGGRTWSFKLDGDAALAEREAPHFLSFVESVRFSAKE